MAVLVAESVDLVVDNVAEEGIPTMLQLLRRGGHYTSSYVVASPIVIIDMRDMYLKNIWLIGTTTWDEPAFPNLIRYIEAGELRPPLGTTWPLCEIAAAQDAFTKNDIAGNSVLIPPEEPPVNIPR